jgi:hypothetical protein
VHHELLVPTPQGAARARCLLPFAADYLADADTGSHEPWQPLLPPRAQHPIYAQLRVDQLFYPCLHYVERAGGEQLNTRRAHNSLSMKKVTQLHLYGRMAMMSIYNCYSAIWFPLGSIPFRSVEA